MSRPAVATPAQVRETISSLLREAGIAGMASAPSFRRAVSVRKVRERLGGGNPATIAHEINALEKDIVGADSQVPVVPPEDTRGRISHGEPDITPDECMKTSRAFDALDEFLESGKRPAWIEYRYVG